MDDKANQPPAALTGFVSTRHPLSPFQAFKGLPERIRPLIAYAPEDDWEYDTRQLPKPLARLRRRVRDFSQTHLAPYSLTLDQQPHPQPGQCPDALRRILSLAGRAGLLTDVLPRPLGSADPRQFAHSLALQQAIRVEELARGCGGLMLSLSAHNLGMAPILLSGDIGAIYRFVLPAFRRLKRGEPALFAFAITEPGAGSDAEDGHGASLYKPGTVAKRTPGGWLLNGRKCFISGGDLANKICVFAALEHEGMESWTCFLVDRARPGFEVVRTELKMGMRASGTAELAFTNVRVRDSEVIGGLRQGWALNRATLNLSRMPVAAMSVGLAQQALDIATDFACRFQLGAKPLIHYQEIQLMLAQMTAETRALRAFVWTHARTWTPRQGDAAMCKFYCSDRAQVVIETAMDLLGNHAMLHSRAVEKTFRDNRLTRIFEGTNQINRLAVIEEQQQRLLDYLDKKTDS